MSNQKTANTNATPTDKFSYSLYRWLLTIFGALFSLGIILVIILFTFRGATTYQAVMVAVLVGFFPISYLAFEVRAGRHKDRLVSRINLLGFADAAEQERWENLYRQLNPAQEYVLFVSMATLVSMFGFGLLRFSVIDANVPGLMLEPFTVQTMFYSFLGAYVFSIYNVSRRYTTYDMTPGVYFQAAVLMVTVIAIGYIIGLTLLRNDALFGVPSVLVPVLAFLIGYFDAGIRFLRSLWERGRNKDKDGFDFDERRELPLELIEGISIWHETRLKESGVDNVQNLASMDIRQLLLTSRYSMPQVMNWVDQAILLITLPYNTITSLQKIGINTMTALIHLLAPVQPADPNDLTFAPTNTDDELSTNELKMLAALVKSNIESSPNLAYVMAYWRAIQQVETEQIRAQTENVLSDITRLAAAPVFANERTLDLLTNLVCTSDLKPDDLVRAFAKDATSAVGLANAYIENNAYEEAIEILTNTITQYGERQSDLSPAYASRGLAYGSLAMIKKNNGDEFQSFYDKADKDLIAATQANPNYAITYIYRGALLLQRKENENSLKELDRAIQLDPTIPKAFLTRGKVYSVLGQYEKAIADFDRTIELARPRDLQRILEDAYYERATLLLNSSRLENAERDFDEEIFLDSQNPLAYLGRGKALLLSGSKSNLFRAIYNFETTISLYQRQQKQRGQDHPDPNTALAFSNIAQAYFQLEQYIDAVTNVQKAFDLGDQSLINYKVRGLSYRQIGDLKQALGDLTYYQTKLEAKEPKSSELPFLQTIIERIQARLNAPVSPEQPPASSSSPPPTEN